MTDHPVNVGHEVELRALSFKVPGDPSLLSSRLMDALDTEGDLWRRGKRAYCRAGAFYPEISALVEMNTHPTSSVHGATEAFEVVARRMQRAAHRAFSSDQGDRGLRALLCVNDDLSGPPPGTSRTGSASTSTGLHTNLTIRGEQDRHATANFLAYVAAILGLVTGAGGFVRTAGGKLQFLRDPRSAHIQARSGISEILGGKPMMKSHRAWGRHELLGLGFSPCRADVTIRMSCLLAAGIACRSSVPNRQLNRYPDPTSKIPIKVDYYEAGVAKKASALDLFEQLLNEVVAPVSRTDAGFLAGVESGLELGIEYVDAMRKLPPWEIASVVPMGWALQCAAFTPLCDEEDVAFPFDGPTSKHPLLDSMAVMSAMNSSLVHHEPIHEFLLQKAGLQRTLDEIWWTTARDESTPELVDTLSDTSWELRDLVERQEDIAGWEAANRPLEAWLEIFKTNRSDEEIF